MEEECKEVSETGIDIIMGENEYLLCGKCVDKLYEKNYFRPMRRNWLMG